PAAGRPLVEVLFRVVVRPAGLEVTREPISQAHRRIAARVSPRIRGAVPDRGAMGEQVAERDARVRMERIPYGEREVARDVVVELEPARLALLHQRGRRKGLR